VTIDPHDTKRRKSGHDEAARPARPAAPDLPHVPTNQRAGEHVDRDGYAAPHLQVYGVVENLTSSGGRIGKNDKAVKHSRTGF
jgi:hypothetical protein